MFVVFLPKRDKKNDYLQVNQIEHHLDGTEMHI